MKKIFGWVGIACLLPFIGAGMITYFIADACVYGWHMAEQMLEDWDD